MNEQMEIILANLRMVWALLSEPIVEMNDSKISFSSLIVSAVVIGLTLFLAKRVGKIIDHAFRNKDVDSGVRDSLEKFSRYIIIAIGFMFALDNLGISLNSLAAVGALLMVGIGFGLQNITQNFISGVIILIERPIKVGDIIRVGDSSGRVIDIRVRSSIIQTRDDVTIIVPNSKILSEEVISDSYSGQQIRYHVRVGVAYGSDVEKVKRLLYEAASAHPKVLNDPPPRAVFENFGDSSLDFDLRFWCSELWYVDWISSDIRSTIDATFRKENIHIPFPQRDLHIKSKM